jgi:hypothetical protein
MDRAAHSDCVGALTDPLRRFSTKWRASPNTLISSQIS